MSSINSVRKLQILNVSKKLGVLKRQRKDKTFAGQNPHLYILLRKEKGKMKGFLRRVKFILMFFEEELDCLFKCENAIFLQCRSLKSKNIS